MISSGFLWAYIADIKGRRAVFLYGYIADGICNFLSGFSQNFWMLVSFKFLSGFMWVYNKDPKLFEPLIVNSSY